MTTQEGIPEGWTEAPLRKLLKSLESGSRPRGGVRHIREGVPSVGGEHLTNDGNFRFDNVKYVPRNFYRSMRRGHLQIGDVLVVKDGATTGKVSLVAKGFPYPEAVVNEHVFVCRPVPGIEPRYLFRFLHSPEGQRRILDHFQGSAQGGINLRFAEGTIVPVPPAAEQVRIAEFLDAAISRLSATQARIEHARQKLGSLRLALLAAACSGRLTADWRQSNTQEEPAWDLARRIALLRAEKSGKRFGKGFDFGQADDLPNGWSWVPVASLVDVATGATPLRTRAEYYGGKIPWITSGAVNAGFITEAAEYVTDLALKETNAKLFPAGTLLIALYGEGQTRGRVAELGFAAATNQALAALVFDDASSPLLRPYLRLFFEENYERIRRLSFGGVQPNLSLGVIRETRIPLPPLREQQEICRRVGLFSERAAQISEAAASAHRRIAKSIHSISSKAFRGELVPTEAELARHEGHDYEDAESLLKRLSKNTSESGYVRRKPAPKHRRRRSVRSREP